MTRPFLLLATTLLAAAPLAAGTLHDPREVRLADVRQLTFGGENAEAYWSFGGDRLVFQSTRPPFACDQIFTMPAHGEGRAEPLLVSTGRGRTTCAFFLPGDERIVYASTDAYTESCPAPPDFSQGYVWPIDPDYELFTTRADGSAPGERVRLTENRAYDAEATVCPKDGAIVFTSTRDGDLDLYRMNADGSEVKRLTSTPGYDGGAFFSADCSKIVWRASRPRGAELEDYRRLLGENLVRPSRLEIWVADADGGNARQVTDLGAASFAPYFFPDGNRILFSSNHGDARGREFDLWAVDVDGTDLERVTFTPGFDGFPIFSPDGEWLAFGSNRNQGKPGETDVYVARWVADAAAATEARAADRFAADAAWLADDAREGRGVGSAGLEAAGAWLEQRFRELGLAPAGEAGGYRQTFPVTVAVRSTAASALAIDGEAAAAEEWTPLAFSAAGPIEGEVVAAGFGVVAPDLGIDDYAGVDVAGKVALVRRFVPAREEFRDAELERRHSDLRLKAFLARERGAIGVLFADLPDPEAPSPDEAPLPKLAAGDLGDAGLPAAAISRALATRLLDGSRRVRLAVELERETAPAFNVLGRLDPAGTPRDGRVVVVGAHYDHLGRGEAGSMEQGSTDVHNGADDNASGVAGLLEAARRLAERRVELGRAVVFAAFSGEERGMLGSAHLVRSPTPGLEPSNVVAMINLDMVGRLRDETLTIFGTESAAEWGGIVETVCAAAKIDCRTRGDGYGPSDQTSFYAADVPVLHLFTGTHDQYHRPSDDAGTLNATGGARIAGMTAELALAAAARPDGLTLRRNAAGPPPKGDTRRFGASLGIVPDYAGPGEGVPGVLLAGTRPGGPAEKAGMRRGDRLIELGGSEIRDINDLMFLLRRAQPGEHVRAVVVRDGERVELDAVYGEPRRM
jgi:Tol biopolymer transport system component